MTNLLAHLERAYWERNQIHALILELTHRCPCRCKHCYVIENPQPDGLSTDEVRDILDQARDEGVFHLMLTGGEILLRPDLEAILDHAHKHRFFVTLLTTGLTLDEPTADMLAHHNIYSMELSLLGASDAVNDELMQVPGALKRIRRAVGLLRSRGLRVTLKATVMRPNVGELEAMAALAHELDCEFSGSAGVIPRRDGSDDPLQLALTEDELAALDPQLLGAGPIPGEDASGGAVLVCKAGRTVAGISPTGDVYPCIVWPRAVGNLRERSLQDIWHGHPDPFLQQVRGLTAPDITACRGCDLRAHCRRCPGAAWLETGSLTEPAPSHCAGARGHARGAQRLT